jgi:hypothetical protein
MKSNPRCLTRAINGAMGERASSNRSISSLLSARNFASFTASLEGYGYHSIGHQGIGGEVRFSFNQYTLTDIFT